MKRFEDSEFYKNTSRNLEGRKINLEEETRELDAAMEIINEEYYSSMKSSLSSENKVYIK